MRVWRQKSKLQHALTYLNMHAGDDNLLLYNVGNHTIKYMKANFTVLCRRSGLWRVVCSLTI